MIVTLEQDAEALRHALDTPGNQISVQLSRATAEMLAHLIDAQAAGQEIVITHGLREVKLPSYLECPAPKSANYHSA